MSYISSKPLPELRLLHTELESDSESDPIDEEASSSTVDRRLSCALGVGKLSLSGDTMDARRCNLGGAARRTDT